jgi:mannose-1-phosphate guanylyltransferase
MANTSAVKGMVLAAGLGTRLRPITDEYPKPLVPMFGVNPLGLAIQQLRSAGIEELAVNTHYRAEKIAQYLGSFTNDSIKISYEPTILGTGGAYNPLREWLGDSHLAVVNGDIVSSIDIGQLVSAHLKSGALATMVLLPAVIPGEPGVFHQNGLITGIRKYGKKSPKVGNFACMQVLSPRFFEFLPNEGVFDIIDTAYNTMLQEGLPIGSFEFSGMWHDIRSPKYYFAALTDIAARWASEELTSIRTEIAQRHPIVSLGDTIGCPRFIGREALVHEKAVLGKNTFIESGAKVENDAHIENSLVLAGAIVKKGTLAKDKILGKSFSIDLA